MDALEPTLTGWIEDALQHGGGTHTIEDVVGCLSTGDAQLFACKDGVVVTEIIQAPRKKYLNVWLAAGNLDGMRFLQGCVMEWAEENQCASVVFHGRRGWERTFLVRDDGWVPTLVTFERAVRVP